MHIVWTGSISRILSWQATDDHLSGTIVTNRLERHFQPKLDTALHRGKDLAVSLSVSPQRFISKRCLSLSLQASLFAPRASLRTGVTRYPAVQCFRTACVRTFLYSVPERNYSDRLNQSVSIIPRSTSSASLVVAQCDFPQRFPARALPQHAFQARDGPARVDGRWQGSCPD